MAGLLFNEYKGDRVRVLLVRCTQPKRPRSSAWLKEMMLLVQAHKSSHILDEEQLAFLADLRIADDCDDISLAKAVHMANLSSYDLDVLFEEKESLLQAFTVFKKESKEKENKYMDKEIDLEKKIKELDNIVYKAGMKSSTSASRSQPSSNTKKNRISCTTNRNLKNKVEDHPRSIKSNSNKKNHVIEPVYNANVNRSMLKVNSELFFARCNKCMFDAIHDLCVFDFVNDMNVRSKSKSSRSSKKKNSWKPNGKVFTDIRYMWKPTGRTFTIDGNKCSLTRITSTTVMLLKETISKLVITQTPKTKVYSRIPKVTKYVGSSSKSKIIESRISNNSKLNQSWGSNTSNVPSSSLVDFRLSKLFSGTVKFGNNQIVKIMGYGNYHMGNITIFKVYYVEELVAIAIACFTQNQSLIRKRHNKTPYELLHNRKPKANIRIFVGYALAKKAYQLYSKRTRLITETIHVDFDELKDMASEQFSSGLGPQLLTPRTISLGLTQNPPSLSPFVPPTKND
uniref:Retroviral polymerase SH3-like domain-containing protein n=1 Tax=Tanacetum cinerariifolium TaxID=118510 RepID=A0A6L2NSM3_TANCI|nr:hypothetical protein [Tanacetum cinerariifolium]